MRSSGIALVVMLLFVCACFALAAPGGLAVQVTVVDGSNQPVSGVNVVLNLAGKPVRSGTTDEKGLAAFTSLEPGRYELSAVKEGLQPLTQQFDLAAPGPTSIELTAVPALARQDSVEVHDTVTPLEQGSSAPEQVKAETAKELPSRPATVADALPLIPGVVRSPEGGLKLSGSGEHRSALIVNSADVTDPATGQFGLTVPIDSVESLNVYQTPFLAEYGRFTAGLVSVETRRGGEKWKWELNDPFPEFRIRSWQMRGLRTATPRLNFEGPLIPGKLYFSEGFEYEVRKTPVWELPFPDNQKKQEGFNSFAQFDWVVSQNQLVTATVHVAPQRMDYVNMSWLNPLPTTPEANTHNYTATVADRLTFGGGLWDNTFSVTRFDAAVWPQGPLALSIMPQGNTGNYFSQQTRDASRTGWSSTYSFGHGTHNFKAGSYIAGSTDRGHVIERPFDVLDAAGLLLERISFTGGQPFRMSDVELAFFGQDHWNVGPHLAFDYGVRTESQETSQAFRVAPRAGVAWTPFESRGTVVRAGFGVFYDRVPLNVYSFASYPNQVLTQFNALGQIAAGPFLYLNGLGEVMSHSRLVYQEPSAGNFSPRSSTWSVQVEQPVTQYLKLRAGYMQNESAGLVILNSLAPDPVTNTGANLLTGTGHSRYRQFEVTARVRLPGKERQLFLSYVRSRARGDLNDFNSFLGSFPAPIIRPNQFGYLPADLPNRFLAWGMVKLPWGFRIAPVMEYRSGFPYAVTDALQNYVGVPYSNRFPAFFSVDSRFSKDIRVNPKYSVRFSVSGFNLMNHWNPEAFHNNIADPGYGYFFGQRNRWFTADFDVLF